MKNLLLLGKVCLLYNTWTFLLQFSLQPGNASLEEHLIVLVSITEEAHCNIIFLSSFSTLGAAALNLGKINSSKRFHNKILYMWILSVVLQSEDTGAV